MVDDLEVVASNKMVHHTIAIVIPKYKMHMSVHAHTYTVTHLHTSFKTT